MGSEPLVLLDSHALLWLNSAAPILGRRARRAADGALRNQRLAVSAISFWEVALLRQADRVDLHQPLERWRADLLESGVQEIPVTGDIGILAATLPGFHADPADRIIVATAATHRALLLTADERILEWPGELRRHDARQ